MYKVFMEEKPWVLKCHYIYPVLSLPASPETKKWVPVSAPGYSSPPSIGAKPAELLEEQEPTRSSQTQVSWVPDAQVVPVRCQRLLHKGVKLLCVDNPFGFLSIPKAGRLDTWIRWSTVLTSEFYALGAHTSWAFPYFTEGPERRSSGMPHKRAQLPWLWAGILPSCRVFKRLPQARGGWKVWQWCLGRIQRLRLWENTTVTILPQQLEPW